MDFRRLKNVEFWLNIWLIFMILLSLISIVGYLAAFLQTPRPTTDYPFLIIFILITDIGILIFCIGIRYRKKWGVYGFFTTHLISIIGLTMLLLSYKEAPVNEMILLSARAAGVTFLFMIITWLLLRPVWEKFKKNSSSLPVSETRT